MTDRRDDGSKLISQKIESIDEGLQNLVNDYITTKQNSLLQMKKGILSREEFLHEAECHVRSKYMPQENMCREIIRSFEQYIFGYSRLSPLIDDESVSDIRVVSFDCVRIKKNGLRMDAGVSFSSEKEYRQFIDYIATKTRSIFQISMQFKDLPTRRVIRILFSDLRFQCRL